MKVERRYAFRRRLEVVHKPGRRDPLAAAEEGETIVGDGWRIAIAERASPLVRNVAKDLQDYFFESMGVSVTLRLTDDPEKEAREGEKTIVLAEKRDLPELGAGLTVGREYRLVVGPERIVVCGFDDRGVGQGSYFLEDVMNLREAPFVAWRDTTRKPLFSPRMAHSGWGLDRFPDAHLNAMAHAGIDAILVFVKDVDKTPEGYQDFNALIDKAASYGIDVYAYSYMISRKHPDDPDAEDYYDSTYGRLFASCPGFKGVVFVGESCEFPSKDPRTTGMLRLEWPQDKPRTKPSPGWWPCADYPQWLNMIKKVVRKHNAEADIVFWTYNWGYAPEKERLELIRAIPDDVTLLVTFEMFEQRRNEHVTNVCVDYTVSFEGPGRYFRSEAEAAAERGIRLYTMSNTGGLTWDIGVIPYEPVPYQWARRHEALHRARRDWGLSGLMESHHYGWWPSFVSDLAKWSYWSPSPPADETFAAVARRDFGAEAAPHVLAAWRCWSDGIRHYVPTNEDQYGPFRVGPSYPMVFRLGVRMPAAWHAMFGNDIVKTAYGPLEGSRQSLGASRFGVEIRSLERMEELWREGNAHLERALALTPERKREEGERLLGMNRFIALCVRTTIHLKMWWLLKQRLFAEPDPAAAEPILEQLARVALAEIANAEAAIPLVEADSRLGWEPSMDYMTDADHLRWKIAQVRTVLEHEFADFRKSLALTGAADGAPAQA
ncbi:hypothetical protein [Paenibacillus flagellatus]|uniref:Beta-hexosaminidase bacterial type N-terminal domain-containing protein n=1 Tax=Paenibacillus flagellatus TaxID=2211139 RepID=A0A2V5K4Y4_9BACL|nr:hypothetical protein [Paenibacillus flagellatus]PYI54361.1 hypothetical protein DLM86_12870 [Paenibacillus flagellatus]